jgi:carbon monoxide dehydrogenase subunit G
MKMEVNELITAPRAEVWKVITDIENSSNVISGIEKVEILEQPADSLVGLKWEETRTMFGQTATEIMWITEAEENVSYQTRAESHGAVYKTSLQLSEENGKTRLTMSFEGIPQSFLAKVMSIITNPIFKKSTSQALKQDLIDIKTKVEG